MKFEEKNKNWSHESNVIYEYLSRLTVTDAEQNDINCDRGFKQWINQTIKIRENSGTLYFIGNGASASMASHYAADCAKNAHLHTEVFSDLSLVTAIANDMGYEWSFAEPLRRRAKKGDMLIAISSSGQSPNILKAVETASEMGIAVVTLSAMREDNSLRKLGNLNFYIPANRYGFAETCHAAVLHHWMDSLEIEH